VAMTSDCIFCRIAAGEQPASLVFESDTVVAFRDIAPAAPVHVLIIPRQHIVDPSSLDETSAPVMADMFMAARTIAAQLGVAESGYRLVMNQGQDGGQSVFHMHLHLLAGRWMAWPPG
jgi:histidine triad (HIT) family protein